MKSSVSLRQFAVRAVFLLSALLLAAAFWPAAASGPATTVLAQPAAAATKAPIFPNAALTLARFTFDCTSTRFQAAFTVTNIDPVIVKTFGTVSYWIGPLRRAAGFIGVQGTTALYADQGTLPHQATEGNVVHITNATITLGTDRGDAVLTANPGAIALKCATIGTATPTATSQAAATQTTAPTSTPTSGATAVPTATETATPTSATVAATAVPTATSTEVATAVPTSASTTVPSGTTGSSTGGAGQPTPNTLPVTGVDAWGRTLILFLLSLSVFVIGLAMARWSRTTR